VQQTINERIKFLIDSLNLSVRGFSAVLDTPASTTRNYLDKGTKPSTDYIERISERFQNVNIHWLITGNGEPFLSSHPTMNANSKNDIKKVKGTVQANTGDTVNNITLDNCQRDLAAAKAEVKALHEQLASRDALLASKDALIAAKDETISLLRASYTRPN
jgi:hypothetical protein